LATEREGGREAGRRRERVRGGERECEGDRGREGEGSTSQFVPRVRGWVGE